MKNLVMVRHSKTEMAAETDMKRQLTEQGMADAVVLGRLFNDGGIKADLIISSNAARAKKTAQLIARGIKFNESSIVAEPLLYHCEPEEIVSFIKNCDDSVKSLIIVGHNPIILQAINLIGSERVARLQTSQAVKFQFGTESWQEIGPDTCIHMIKIF